MEPTNEPSLLEKAKVFAERHFKEQVDERYVFHDFEHTAFVVPLSCDLATGLYLHLSFAWHAPG